MNMREFRRAVRRNYNYLVRFARSRKYGEPRERVHDAITAVSGGSYRNFEPEGTATIRTWLAQALVYTNVMHERAKAREPEIVPLTEDLEADDNYTMLDLKIDLERGLAKVPERARRVFYLTFVEGYTQEEAAVLLGAGTRTIERDLHDHIRPVLATIMTEYEDK